MLIVFLRFSDNKAKAADYMPAHKNWINAGVSEGFFQLVASFKPAGEKENAGGAILVHGLTIDELNTRLQEDPFVTENVVVADIIELTPNIVSPRLDYLLGETV